MKRCRKKYLEDKKSEKSSKASVCLRGESSEKHNKA